MYLFMGALGLVAVGWLAFGAKPQPRRNPRRKKRKTSPKEFAKRMRLWAQLTEKQKNRLRGEVGWKGRVSTSALQRAVREGR
jgi:hypothetical protein